MSQPRDLPDLQLHVHDEGLQEFAITDIPNQQISRSRFRIPILVIASISIVLVAVLFIHTVTQYSTNGWHYNITPVAGDSSLVCMSPATSVLTGGCQVTDAATGISLRVTQAYADVTGTFVQLQAANKEGYSPFGSEDTSLKLSSGKLLPVATAGTVNGCFESEISQICDEPLPFDNMGHPVQLIASSHFFADYMGTPLNYAPPPAPPWKKDLYRLQLSVPFEIVPQAAAHFVFQQASNVQKGIRVRAQSLDISPPGKAFYGDSGGARIFFTVSGLPPDTELLSFIRAINSSGIGLGGISLNIPGMHFSALDMGFLLQPSYASNGPSNEQTIGAGGIVLMELTYIGNGIPTGKAATLGISNVHLLSHSSDGQSGDMIAMPAYQVTLPLQ
jgi:hypothetical protein